MDNLNYDTLLGQSNDEVNDYLDEFDSDEQKNAPSGDKVEKGQFDYSTVVGDHAILRDDDGVVIPAGPAPLPDIEQLSDSEYLSKQMQDEIDILSELDPDEDYDYSEDEVTPAVLKGTKCLRLLAQGNISELQPLEQFKFSYISIHRIQTILLHR